MFGRLSDYERSLVSTVGIENRLGPVGFLQVGLLLINGLGGVELKYLCRHTRSIRSLL